ncbi:hypothetical protein [Aurantiacibacter flavus]|uniref:DUF4402 domain-containing protein n=1 Tax=Aurantiacibacter flavus TaxID=3145232 RepID=A0ABV0D0E4_9SPHN
MTRTLPLLLAPLILAACNEGAPEPPVASDEPAAPVASGVSMAEGQSAPIMLDVIMPEDIAAEPLDGELGCSFSFSRNDDPLLVAKGFVDSQRQAMGAVKIDGTVMRLAKDGKGGFGDMPDGASFTNGTVSARVEVTGEADPGAAPSESPLKTARLTIARGTRQIVIDGFYACGP